MGEVTHRIRRLRWLARVGSQEDGLAVRSRLRELSGGELVEWLSDVFDGAAGADEVIRLPRLEVRLAVTSADLAGEDFADQVRARVRDRLREAAKASGAALPTPAGPGPLSPLAGLIGYLETGTLPWDLLGSPPEELAISLASTARHALDHVAARFQEQPTVGEATAFLFRLLAVVPTSEWPVLVRRLAVGASGVPLGELAATLTGAGAATDRSVLQHILAAVVAATSRLPADHVAPHMFPLLAPGEDQIGEPGWGLPASSAVAVASFVEQWATTAEGAPTATAEPPDPSAPGARGIEASDPGDRRRTLVCSSGSEPLGPRDSEQDGRFGLMVSNAGLILLNPFLERFFAAVGILPAPAGGLAGADLSRAAGLLWWLAVGERMVYEFELGFVKVLLGLRPEDPLVVVPAVPNRGDREEGEALLGSMIRHWAGLGNTSVAGLRSSFLQRSGLLEEEGPGWHLTVEPRTWDVLLDRLPWGFRTVKMPWMTRPIVTDWPA